MNTLRQVGDDLLRIHAAAAGRTFTKSQSEDFWSKASDAVELMQGEAAVPLNALQSATKALTDEDADGFVKAITTRGTRKTQDGDPGAPARERPSSYSYGDGDGSSVPGRKSLHSDSWGDAVLAAGADSGMKALVPSGSTAVSVPLTPTPVTDGKRVTFLRQLIPTQLTDSGSFGYLRQTLRTNNAAVVAEAALKPTSIYTLARVDDRVDTIAHLSEPIPRQYLDDAPLLRQWVDSELRYGLDLALDAEIVTALLSEAETADAGADILASIRGAITDLEELDLAPNGIAMSPADWQAVETAAQETFAANPTMSPTNAFTRRLYGIPVVVTTSLMGEGAVLVGAFDTSSVLYLRQQARVDWSEATFDPAFGGSGASDFARNLIRFRAEMRAKLAVTRPAGFVQVATGS